MHKFFVLTPHSYEILIDFVRLLFGELKKKSFIYRKESFSVPSVNQHLYRYYGKNLNAYQ